LFALVSIDSGYDFHAQMKTMGHKPDTSFVLHDVEDEEKKKQNTKHLQKLYFVSLSLAEDF